jgi:hypothetical protein
LPVPRDPFWISVPAAVFNRPEAFPAGTRAFLSPLAHAEKVVFSAGPQGDRLQLRLEVSCATSDAAAELVKQFSGKAKPHTLTMSRHVLTERRTGILRKGGNIIENPTRQIPFFRIAAVVHKS